MSLLSSELQIVSKCFQVIPNGTLDDFEWFSQWLQIISNDSKQFQIVPNSSEWFEIVSVSKWFRMFSNGFEWFQSSCNYSDR